MPVDRLQVAYAQGGAQLMGNIDGGGETMYEEIPYRVAEPSFLVEGSFANGKETTDPDYEDSRLNAS